MQRLRSVLPLLLATGLGACAASTSGSMSASAGPNELSASEQAEGWRLLFDGQSFAGWRRLGGGPVPAGHWEIVDGSIRKKPSGQVAVAADGQPVAGGDIITEATFNDYELAFEWKVTPGANSGLKYNVDEQFSLGGNPSARAALGFEYQVLDDERHPDANMGPAGTRRASSLYDLVPAAQNKPIRPVGEWNESRIVFRGNHGEHWLNGVKVLEYDLGTPAMQAAFAKSKWSNNPRFIERKRDHRIVLQDHNDEVFYRNIKVRELN